jgi:hypothetical protein
MKKLLLVLVMLLGLLGGSVYGGINAAPGSAGSGDPPLPPDAAWHQFDWGPGTPAPTSPGPWTFDLGAFTSVLDVTDALIAGDRFEVFDWGGSIGLTSLPSTSNWTDNIDFAFADPRWSSGSFAMGPGAHSISINTVQNPYGYGSAYLRLNQIPEPASLVVWGLLAGLGLIVVHRKMKK